MRILVMGGTRFMGVKLVERLLERGHEITVANRGSRRPGWSGRVAAIVGDRCDPAFLRRLAGHQFDGIVDFSAYTRAQTSTLLDVHGTVGRLVHISSGSVYAPQPTLPWAENTPYGPWALWGQYAVAKLACELELRKRRSDVSTATSVLRFPFVLGPRNYAPREEFVLNRLLDEAVILVPGDGKAVQQFVSVDQVAHTIVSCVEQFADGGWRAYNVASPELASLEGFVQVCARVASVDANVVAVGGGATGTDRPIFDAADCVFPFPNENYVLDVSASLAAGIAPPHVPLESMVAEALSALLDAPEARQWQRTGAEDAVLARTG